MQQRQWAHLGRWTLFWERGPGLVCDGQLGTMGQCLGLPGTGGLPGLGPFSAGNLHRPWQIRMAGSHYLRGWMEPP